MGRRIAICLVLGALCSPWERASGQSPPTARGPNLLVRSDAAQFEIVLGRIVATHIRLGPARAQAVAAGRPGGLVESLVTGMHGNVPTLHYERCSDAERLTVDFFRDRCVGIRWATLATANAPPGVLGETSDAAAATTASTARTASTAAQDSPAADETAVVAFHQDARGRVQLNVERAELRGEFSAPSVWHLLLAEPKICREHLTPLLEILRPHWDLNAAALEVRDAMLLFPSVHALPSANRIQQLVAALGDPEFRKRQAADRQLRDLGPIAIAYLQTLDRTQLDSEQRQRVRNIVGSLKAPAGDTPERVAHWLASDRTAWLIFLADADRSTRQIAVDHLRKLVDRPFDFEPSADPETRSAQCARLKKSWAFE